MIRRYLGFPPPLLLEEFVYSVRRQKRFHRAKEEAPARAATPTLFS